MESVRREIRDPLISNRSKYDVFLSFRGPDARFGIVDHLYECMTGAGRRVFKDDEDIRHGEVIGGELKQAIDGSRIYTVVFSRNYASSAWCLKELDMMMDLCGGSNVGRKIILPIFYGADPADVKLRTKLYQETLDKHKGQHGHSIVKKWEEALKTVGAISGWDSKAIQGEGRFVRLIVQDIVVKLRIKDQSLPHHLTGIEDRVFDMLNLLDCDSSGVRLVVLHGMGGIGKTTLARVIFNNLSSQFEGSSFISNVRESTMDHGGIAKLQNKLSGDILGCQYARSCNFDDGYGGMIQRIQGKRMLLVLDDVDRLSQLEKLVGKDPKDTLGIGSRVIITTRDKNVCNRFVHPGSELLHFYEMEKMADNYALQLFSRHAFGTDEPPEDYISLSKDVVETTGNLPLALVVMGGHLCGQSKESWKYELEKLKNVPQEEVFDILKVSYDGLGFREKEIFLDIVCFGEAMRRRYADYFWEARDLYPKGGVKILINKSLIEIDSNGEFWIHDQLRDMGREIVRSEGLGRPEICTRLWDPHHASKIVLQKKVSEKIIAMDLGSIIEEHNLSDENFRGLCNLMYLRLEGKHQIIGDFGSIQETLMWLSWGNCNKLMNPDIFKMSNLVVLEIEGRWGSVEMLIMPKLRVLVVRGYSDMTTTPDVSCCLKLEIMVFEYFENLEEIHLSVGKLESLTYLKISYCPSLRSSLEELCSARALQELIVTDCKIEEVSKSIGRLESLRTLELRDNNIRILPASICVLNNLLVLDVSHNPLDKGIPDEIGSLSALENLELSGSKICFLPTMVSLLTSLKSLKLKCCKMLQELRGLPTSLTVLDASDCHLDKGISEKIGNLSALEELDLSGSKIRFLPATVRRFTSLKSLKLNCCMMLEEVRGLPTSLTVLDASRCPFDKGIPEKNRNLSVLKELNLSGSKIRFLPEIVRHLTNLKSLKLNCCTMLQEVQGLPTSLTVLDASHCPFEKGIPEKIGNLLSLEELDLSYTNIRFLPAVVSQLTSLKSLKLNCCRMLLELRGLPTNLTVLHASCCPLDEVILEEIGNLSALEELDLSGSKIRFLPAIVRRLTSLKSLKLNCCRMLQEVRGLPTSLTVLDASDCPLDKGIPNKIGSLSALKKLNLSYTNIRFLPATVSQLSSLKSLKLNCCKMLQEVRGLPSTIMVLDASRCPLDEGISEEIGNLSALEELDLSYTNIRFLPATVRRLTSLKSLKLNCCRMLLEVRGLPTSLTVLHVSYCPLDKGIPEEIGNLSALEELNLSGSKIRFLPATVSRLTSLKSLELRGCNMLQELRGLPTSLTYFAFSWETVGLSEEIRCTKTYGKRIITYRGVLEFVFLSRLKTLGLSFPGMVSVRIYMEIRDFTLTEMELGGLDSLPSLTNLFINESHSLLRVSNIRRLRGLRSLEFRECRALVEIPGLEQLEMLEELSFHRCPSIRGIQDLLGLERLKIVDIWDCSSLLRLPRLIDECHLRISCCVKLRKFEGRFSEYEGESSKIQLEDDSGE